MIRPTVFWQQQRAVPGASVFMEFPELEVSTHATVRKVEPCPPIAEGTGNVVTARIVTLTATDLVEITLETGETITGTPPHPIWSVEEDDWIELGEIEEGDFVLTDHGPLEVIETASRTTAETVYNVEVHGHHVYYIGDDGVLVHNATAKYNTGTVGKVVNRLTDKASRVSLRGKSLISGARALKRAGLKRVKGENGAWLFKDKFNNIRAKWVPRTAREPQHWSKYAPGNRGQYLNNAGRKVSSVDRAHRIPSNGGGPIGGVGPGAPTPIF
jgi:hypothetical protein